MKNLLIFLCSALVAATVSTVNAQSDQPLGDVTPSDSVINVIAWFSKGETATYRLSESSWNITPADTTLISGMASTATIHVVDSTSEGYKLEFRYLDINVDTVADNPVGRITKKVMEKFVKKICGTPIKFETDQMGTITAFTNTGDIKKQFKAMIKEVSKQLASLPEMKDALKYGINIKGLVDAFDSDQIIDGYVNDVNLLFAYYGLAFEMGDHAEHIDRTADQYENMVYTTAVKNSDGRYAIVNDVISEVPEEDLKSILAQTLRPMLDDETYKTAVDALKDIPHLDADISSTYQANYFPDGWPEDVVYQTKSIINGNGKVQQTSFEMIEFK